MYRGYSVTKLQIDQLFKRIGYSRVANIDAYFKIQKSRIEDNLYSVLNKMDEGVLDGKLIQEDWFPTVKAGAFISHSHKDLALAKCFAGWLWGRFKITPFIDSCIWGYADDLLKKIDDKYCWDDKNKTYNYEKRNLSTSHVHMMLMTALSKMIDKTECIFFLNTPNSNIGDGIKSSTLSPWIYGEIEISRLIQKKQPTRDYTRKYDHGGKIDIKEKLAIKYPLNLGHFYNLSHEVLSKWDSLQCYNAENALDKLYNLTKTIIYD